MKLFYKKKQLIQWSWAVHRNNVRLLFISMASGYVVWPDATRTARAAPWGRRDATQTAVGGRVGQEAVLYVRQERQHEFLADSIWTVTRAIQTRRTTRPSRRFPFPSRCFSFLLSQVGHVHNHLQLTTHGWPLDLMTSAWFQLAPLVLINQ